MSSLSVLANSPERALGRARRLERARLLFGASIVLGLPLALASNASAGSNTIGSFQLSGQANGKLTIPRLNPGTGYTFYGCAGQSSESSSPSVLIQLNSAKLQVAGSSTTATGIEIDIVAAATGKSESLVPNGTSKVTLVLVSNKKTYLWASTAGNVQLTKQGVGSLSASLLPAGGPTLADNPIQSGKATKPVHVSGSWTSCHGTP